MDAVLIPIVMILMMLALLLVVVPVVPVAAVEWAIDHGPLFCSVSSAKLEVVWVEKERLVVEEGLRRLGENEPANYQRRHR